MLPVKTASVPVKIRSVPVKIRSGLFFASCFPSPQTLLMKKILFIINPISGTHKKRGIPNDIKRYIDTSRYAYEIKFTARAGHAAEMAREAAATGVDIVVAVGGDGTVNEVARSLIHTQTALGIIPCGSGNGLARHLHISTNPQKAIEILNQGVVHCLDYGRINDLPFFCTCGMGFDAFVSKKFSDSGQRGLLQYAKNTIGIGMNYKSERYKIDFEDGTTEETDAFLISCANASQYGNNAYIAPTASMKDGLMDIILMKPINPIQGAQVLLQMFTKSLLANKNVRLLRGKEIRITRTNDGPVHCDGDPVMMGREISIKLIPHSFNVVVNPEVHPEEPNIASQENKQMRMKADIIFSEKEEPLQSDTAEPEMDIYNLARFVEAQARDYERALLEIRAGRKLTHWMWYVFPQLKGLGNSTMSKFYAISCREEAEAYLRHPILGPRLIEITQAVLTHKDRDAFQIFGAPDDVKLRSCMTLFSAIADEGNIFERVLNSFYEGKPCIHTLQNLS